MTAPALRVAPSVIGGLLGAAIGSLVLDSLCTGRPEPNGAQLLPYAIALWIVVAGGIFAANEAWRGGSASAWLRTFGWSLLTALALLLLPLVLLTVAVMILEALGGHL